MSVILIFVVSQMVIEEVSAIQENLEIERTCRESAEALASKVRRMLQTLLLTNKQPAVRPTVCVISRLLFLS